MSNINEEGSAYLQEGRPWLKGSLKDWAIVGMNRELIGYFIITILCIYIGRELAKEFIKWHNKPKV